MRKFLLVITSLSFASSAFAQPSYDLGLYCNRQVSDFQNTRGASDPFQFNGFNIGLKLGRKFLKADLQFGVLYAQMSRTGIVDVHCDGLSLPKQTLETGYLELQGSLRGYFNNFKKIRPFVNGGLSCFLFPNEINYNSKVDPEWANGAQVLTRTNEAALLFSAGLRCGLSHNFSVDLEPNIKYFIPRSRQTEFRLPLGFAVTLNYLLKRKKPTDHFEDFRN